MNLTINIPDEQVNDLVIKVIKGRVQYLLRNEEELVQIINEVLEREIYKKLNIELLNHPLRQRIEQAIWSKLPSQDALSKRADKQLGKLIGDAIAPLMQAIKDDLKVALKEEIQKEG